MNSVVQAEASLFRSTTVFIGAYSKLIWLQLNRTSVLFRSLTAPVNGLWVVLHVWCTHAYIVIKSTAKKQCWCDPITHHIGWHPQTFFIVQRFLEVSMHSCMLVIPQGKRIYGEFLNHQEKNFFVKVPQQEQSQKKFREVLFGSIPTMEGMVFSLPLMQPGAKATDAVDIMWWLSTICMTQLWNERHPRYRFR